MLVHKVRGRNGKSNSNFRLPAAPAIEFLCAWARKATKATKATKARGFNVDVRVWPLGATPLHCRVTSSTYARPRREVMASCNARYIRSCGRALSTHTRLSYHAKYLRLTLSFLLILLELHSYRYEQHARPPTFPPLPQGHDTVFSISDLLLSLVKARTCIPASFRTSSHISPSPANR